MKVEQYIDELREHGAALAAAAEQAGVDAPVPTCPGWAVRDLLGHIGRVHRWAATFVGTARTQPPTGDDELAPTPSDDELVDWFTSGHTALVSTLARAPADLECWAFLPAPSPLAFWARRQAHETAIHRLDADAAAGRSTSYDSQFAVNGIDELLLGFFARPRSRLVSDPPVSLGVSTTDTDPGDAWTVVIGAGHREINRGIARGDCVITGPAADLYPMLWNRRGTDGLDVAGNHKVLDLWRAKATVNWS